MLRKDSQEMQSLSMPFAMVGDCRWLLSISVCRSWPIPRAKRMELLEEGPRRVR